MELLPADLVIILMLPVLYQLRKGQAETSRGLSPSAELFGVFRKENTVTWTSTFLIFCLLLMKQ